MQRFSPTELVGRLKSGLLSFPVTPFAEDLSLDVRRFAEHVDWQSSFDVAGLFVGGGTGEGFSLTQSEMAEIVRIAVDVAGDRVPVLGAASGNTQQAVETAQAAELAGAAGLLLFPPYLTEADQIGLEAHVASVCQSTSLGVIIYNRANAVFEAETVARLAARYPHFIGFKDGIGNIEQLSRVRTLNGDRLFYLGGLPTAETYAAPLLRLGMSTYSSALFNFLPEFALEFYQDVRREDDAAVTRKLKEFVLPYAGIRERRRGYGVSIVKAGLRSIKRGCGPVRPPLQDLDAEEQAELDALVATTLEVAR
jgi:5-dehydro-4-deoxyglucarate dehydratase